MSAPTLEVRDPGIGDRVVRLYAQLDNMEQVARELRIGHSSVHRILRARGIDTSQPVAKAGIHGVAVPCANCGKQREVNMSRGYSAYCQGCKPIHGEVKIACGTEAGVLRHRENGHPLCKPCRAAAVIMDAAPQTAAPELVYEWTGPTPVITWRKGPSGILHGIVLVDAEPEAVEAA